MAKSVKEPIPLNTPKLNHSNPLISHDKLRELYSLMLKSRLVDERAQIFAKQECAKNIFQSSAGQEAIAAGAVIDLRPTDMLAPPPRNLILSYLKGVPLTAIFEQLHRISTGPKNWRSSKDGCGYAQLNVALPTSTVAAQLKASVDFALASQRKKDDSIAMAFGGERSIPPNAWHEAMRTAGKRSLPIVFVHQKLLVDLPSPSDHTNAGAASYGFPEIAVDGNDAVAVFRVAQEAVERARFDGGPTLIQAHTWPSFGTRKKDRTQHRAPNKIEHLESADPIAGMERYLISKGLFSEGWKLQIVTEFQQQLDCAVQIAEKHC